MKPIVPQNEQSLIIQMNLVNSGKNNSINLEKFQLPIPDNNFHNCINHIAEHSPSVEKLKLDYNNLVSLGERIKDLKNLKYLSLKNNNFKNIPDNLESLPQNCVVDLKENPMSLESLLKISDSSKINYVLDEEHRDTVEKIKSSSKAKEITKAFVKEYPEISIKG